MSVVNVFCFHSSNIKDIFSLYAGFILLQLSAQTPPEASYDTLQMSSFIMTCDPLDHTYLRLYKPKLKKKVCMRRSYVLREFTVTVM